MIQMGQMCRTCKGGKCVDEPSPLNAYEMNCPSCEGLGCKQCNDLGKMSIESCPQAMVDHKTWRLLRYADFYNKGLPPVSGGLLDQAEAFVSGAYFVSHEQNRLKAELGIIE